MSWLLSSTKAFVILFLYILSLCSHTIPACPGHRVLLWLFTRWTNRRWGRGKSKEWERRRLGRTPRGQGYRGDVFTRWGWAAAFVFIVVISLRRERRTEVRDDRWMRTAGWLTSRHVAPCSRCVCVNTPRWRSECEAKSNVSRWTSSVIHSPPLTFSFGSSFRVKKKKSWWVSECVCSKSIYSKKQISSRLWLQMSSIMLAEQVYWSSIVILLMTVLKHLL